MRRAGLDYAAMAASCVHRDFAACLEALGAARLFAIETSGTRAYGAVDFVPGDAFVLGSEHRGLAASVLERIPPGRRLAIPMRSGNRSLNLANAAAVVLYEAWRQNDFAGAAPLSGS